MRARCALARGLALGLALAGLALTASCSLVYPVDGYASASDAGADGDATSDADAD